MKSISRNSSGVWVNRNRRQAKGEGWEGAMGRDNELVQDVTEFASSVARGGEPLYGD